jgi:GNAT superfamily N-acetyltransferase
VSDEADEHLATGWDPGTAITDTFLRAASLSVADVALGARMGRRTVRTDAFAAADHGVPSGFGNIVTLLQPLPYDGWPAVLDELEGFFGIGPGGPGGPGRGTVELFSPWPTPDLRARGWFLYGHPPLMTRPAGPLPSLPAPAGLRIVEVADEATLLDFERTVVESFPLPEAAPLLGGGLLGPAVLDDDRWRFFVGYEADTPVTTAAVLVDHGHNHVNFVATRPEARRRGYGEAVTWRATLADPARPAALLASDPGRPVYERMGFGAVLRFTLWGFNRG